MVCIVFLYCSAAQGVRLGSGGWGGPSLHLCWGKWEEAFRSGVWGCVGTWISLRRGGRPGWNRYADQVGFCGPRLVVVRGLRWDWAVVLSCLGGSHEKLEGKTASEMREVPEQSARRGSAEWRPSLEELPSLKFPGSGDNMLLSSEPRWCPLFGEVVWPVHWQNVETEC